MSLSELATRLDLAPSTTHGIVRTLVEHGMVVQERGSSRYQLGAAVLRLGECFFEPPQPPSQGGPGGGIFISTHSSSAPRRRRGRKTWPGVLAWRCAPACCSSRTS